MIGPVKQQTTITKQRPTGGGHNLMDAVVMEAVWLDTLNTCAYELPWLHSSCLTFQLIHLCSV